MLEKVRYIVRNKYRYEIEADYMRVMDGVALFFKQGYDFPMHSAPADKVIIIKDLNWSPNLTAISAPVWLNLNF